MTEPVLGVASSLTGRRWLWRHGEDRIASASPSGLACRRSSAGCSPRAALASRAAADFIAPTLRALLPDPSVLLDMDIAAERLARAATAGETVAVFGDYDVDGACSGGSSSLCFCAGFGLHAC